MHRTLLALIAAAFLASSVPCHASLSKLDPLARIALAELRAGSRPEALRARRVPVAEGGALDVFIQGEAGRAELERAGARVRTTLDGVVTAYLPADAVERVAALPGVRAIVGSGFAEPSLNVSVPTTGAPLMRGPGPAFAGFGWNGDDVIVGVVDAGIDFDHGDFEDAAGNTRVLHIWDQFGSGSPPPPSFGYGAEWSAAQIDLGMCTEIDHTGHGTHVLGIAAGDGSATGGSHSAFEFTGMAPKADLIAVRATNSTGFSQTNVIDGVSYIFQRATALGKKAVVNLSLGGQAGPHDGTSAFESALDALSGPGRIVVVASGNERGAPIHAEVFAAGSGTNTTLSVAGSATGRAIAIDGYYESTENLSVQITTPNATVIGPITLGASNATYPGQLTGNGVVYLENGVSLTTTGDRRVYIEIQVTSGMTQNANGIWTLRFIPVALGAANGEVDLWRFVNSPPEQPSSFLLGVQNNEEIIREPGNAVHVITVSGFTSKQNWLDCNGNLVSFVGTTPTGSLASFSSSGPTRDGRQKPEIAAPGVAIGSATDFDLPQVCPPMMGLSLLLDDGLQHVMNSGTSMSAPHVAGAVALLLQKYGALTPAQVRAHLQARAVTDGFTGATWNKDWGHGKLHVGDLVDPSATVVFPNGGEQLFIVRVVDLEWNASDLGGSGVTGVDLRLSRSGPGGPFEDIALGVPNTGSYEWDVTGPPSLDAWLQVTVHDGDGNLGVDLSDAAFTITVPTGVEGGVPAELALAPVAPNPTAGRAAIAWSVPHEARVRVAVADVQGRVVEVLADGVAPPGRYRATWPSTSDRTPSPGLYFVSLEGDGRRIVRRVVIAH